MYSSHIITVFLSSESRSVLLQAHDEGVPLRASVSDDHSGGGSKPQH